MNEPPNNNYPGPAIGPFHWESRGLSARELAALQTPPADYEVLGDMRATHKQLGTPYHPRWRRSWVGRCGCSFFFTS